MAKARYTKRPDGRYEAKVWDGTFTDTGRKNYIHLYSEKSSRDLESKVAEYNQARKEGRIVVSTNTTVLTYARAWLKGTKGTRAGGTYNIYENIIETHISTLGDISFEHLTHSMIQLLINENVKKPQTCKQIVMTCKQIVKSAEKDRLLPKGSHIDIFDDLEVPDYTPKERRPLTAQEKAVLTTADLTPRERMFVMILYGTGFRRGEALALTVFDISFKNKTVRVDKSLALDSKNKTSYIKEPKTKNSYRTNPIPDWLVTELRSYVANLDPANQSRLFCENGELMTHNDYQRMWHSIVNKMRAAYLSTLDEKAQRMVNWNEVGFEDLTAHLFRHNYCTALCYQMIQQRNISLKKIARLLGDTEKMVQKVYSHILEEMEQTEDAISAAVSL